MNCEIYCTLMILKKTPAGNAFVGTRRLGSVVSFVPEKYGFVSCPSMPGDLFFAAPMAMNPQDVHKGVTVEFDVAMDKGKGFRG